MFTHLSVRSFYSFGAGTASVEALCQRARTLGYQKMALTDINGLYAIGWFYKACAETGLTPIVGAEIRHRSGRALLLARNRTGYSNLCHLLSACHLEDDFSLDRALAACHQGLIAITDDFNLLLAVKTVCDRGSLYVELRPGGNMSTACRFSKMAGLPLVATNDVHFLEPQDYDLHRKLRAIARKETLSTLPVEQLADREAWLKSPQQMADFFRSHPEALANSEHIAECCAGFELTFTRSIFPRYETKSDKTSSEVLRELTMRSAKTKYLRSPYVMARLQKELDMIIRKGFADTFLIMRDIVKKSKYTCGRGSAAASLVSYLLEITDVDPISCNLYFGRFLNEARTDPPDIDMDFCRCERRAIMDSVYEQYGEKNVALVANHVRMGMRQAIRRLAELEGLPQAEISRVTKFIAGRQGSIAAYIKQHPMFRNRRLSDKWPEILRDAERLVGIPLHLSLHPGGMVIAPDGIDHYIPRQRSRNGLIAIQTEKDQTEGFLKFVKFDILGSSSLCVLRDTIRAVKQQEGLEIDFRDWQHFARDPKTVEMIAAAQTMACVYIESAATLQLLQKIGPRLRGSGPVKLFNVLTIVSSIIRPASNDNIREFVRRLYGGKFEYLHPKLEGVLSETLGLVVYQEHVNLIAMALAGFSEIEADRLRKALTSKKSDKLIRELIQKYLTGCQQNGVSIEVAKKTAAQILKFMDYSFLKAHSASYIILALACVYLKAHYPAQYMAARLSHEGGFWGLRAYLSECERLGLEILMPDINQSRVECTGRKSWLRLGLMRIKAVRQETMANIVAERDQHGAYRSFLDFLKRVPVEDDEMAMLIMAGVFDALEPDLPRGALHYLYAHWAGVGEPAVLNDWYGEQRAKAKRLCRDYGERERLQHEIEVFGTLVTCHPFAQYRHELKRLRRVFAKDLPQHAGKVVCLAGLPIASKEVVTKTKKAMQFRAFEDETGVFHAVLFPRAYEKFCQSLVESKPLIISGIADEEHGAVTVNIQGVAELETV